jgi:hypothetical protein
MCRQVGSGGGGRTFMPRGVLVFFYREADTLLVILLNSYESNEMKDLNLTVKN